MADFTKEQYQEMLWLTKVSILSFQNRFPAADFLLLYNGSDFATFRVLFEKTTPVLSKPITIIDQHNPDIFPEKFNNPYHFFPRGVWWKWVPFRFDITKHEIAVDTDIICIGEPKNWHEWLASDKPILIAPERYEVVMVNTCGDFCKHPLLREKKPFNCGVVGQRAGHDYSERFFEVTKAVELGETHNSMFITEQGAINLWVRSLEVDGIGHFVLDFARNAWIRDFLFFSERGVQVETVHAVTWHKEIVKGLAEAFERRVCDLSYTWDAFRADLLREAKGMDELGRYVLRRQLTPNPQLSTELLLS